MAGWSPTSTATFGTTARHLIYAIMRSSRIFFYESIEMKFYSIIETKVLENSVLSPNIQHMNDNGSWRKGKEGEWVE